jgi:hypothetical protein
MCKFLLIRNHVKNLGTLSLRLNCISYGTIFLYFIFRRICFSMFRNISALRISDNSRPWGNADTSLHSDIRFLWPMIRKFKYYSIFFGKWLILHLQNSNLRFWILDLSEDAVDINSKHNREFLRSVPLLYMLSQLTLISLSCSHYVHGFKQTKI